MEDKGNFEKYAKKKASRKRAFHMAVFLLIILSIILIVINWDKITAPLKDAALDLDDGGFPVQLAGSPDYSMQSMGDNICLLTDMHLTAYTLDGAKISETQHGLQNPAMLTNSKRALIYDVSGKEFGLYSRTGNIFKKNVEDTIVFAALSADERCAVVTTSARYVNTLYVYNGEGEQIFRYNSPLDKLMQVEFSDDGKSIFVSMVGASNGEFSLKILRFDLKNSDSAMWAANIGSALTYKLDYSSDGLYAVTENGAMLLDIESGEVLFSTGYSKSVNEIITDDKQRLTVFNDTASNGSVVTAYGGDLSAVGSVTLLGAIDIAVDNGRVFVLTASEITEFNSALEQVNSTEVSGVYSQIIVSGSSAYLLGYNAIDRLEIQGG